MKLSLLPIAMEKFSSTLRFQLFPRSVGISDELQAIVKCFESVHANINSSGHNLNSDGVLKILRPGLEALGCRVETGKSKSEKIPVPVLFGLNNHIDKSFGAVP